MSETRLLWCLLDTNNPKEKAFPVQANRNWTIDELTEEISTKKAVLRDLDTSDILLWKVNELIQVTPLDSFHKRLPISLADSCFALNDPAWAVSQYIPEDLPRNVLHLMVSYQDQRPYKRRRLDPEPSEISENWKLLWQIFWGKPATECLVKASTHIPDPRTLEPAKAETNYEYLELPDDGDMFPCRLHRIFITETYKTLYKRLCEEDKLFTEMVPSERLESLAHSTIVTGQPGTGKTVGLSCILVWRLQEKKPTVYCSTPTHAYVFTDSGVDLVSLKDERRIEALEKNIHCCALVDINPFLKEVPIQFQPSLRSRVVVATSPNLDHVTAFKQNDARTFYTPTWKWTDLYCAAFIRPSFDPETLRDAYTKLGGIPRRCFRALLPKGNEHEMQKINQAIDTLKDLKDFAASASGSLPFKNNVSHVLIRMEPTDDTWKDQITYLLSNYVAELVYDRINRYRTIR